MNNARRWAGQRRALAAGVAILTGLCATPSRAADDVTQERLLNADQEQGNWLLHHKDFAAHRFSDLTQITKDNVKNLHVAFTVQLGGVEGGGIWSHGGLEGTPIAENGFLYVTDGWGSVYKIDTHGGKGALVWKMDPKTDHDWAGAVACCGVDNRGVALWNGMVVSHTLDGRLVVTDKQTGQVAWQLQVANPDKGEAVTGAPLVVKNMAITGVSGGEFGIRGWMAATDLTTHKELWRTHTIPGAGEPGAETWAGENNAAVSGGAPTWVTGSYDPQSNTLYWGTGNPGPDWEFAVSAGRQLLFRQHAGARRRHRQDQVALSAYPNDPFDYDSVSENVLVDVAKEGGTQKLALEADRNGFAYAVDRSNGQFVWGLPFVKRATWTKGLDAKTGKPLEYDPSKQVQVYNVATTPSVENSVVTICPGNMGGKNWPPTAYNPGLHTWYIPVIESCNKVTVKAEPGQNKPREWFTGGGPTSAERITGSVTAIDVATGKESGKFETPFPMLGGILATPDLVFAGQPDGEVFALDAKTLQKLWSFSTGAGVNAPPMTFTADGKQYIAILAGMGGAWDKWFIDSTPELKSMQPGSVLYVFAL